MAEQKYESLYQALLGDRQDVQQVLDEASTEIGKIGERNKTIGFRSVRRGGASWTNLYEFKAARPKTTG